MSNKNHEQCFIEKFLEFAKTNNIEVLNSNCHSRTTADLVFTIQIGNKKEEMHAEVKVAKSSNKYNNALLIFGDILKNRCFVSKKDAKTQSGNSNVFFSVFLPYSSYGFFKEQFRKISSNDWKNFGSQFGCKYFFFFDSKNSKLFYTQWEDALNSSTLSEWSSSHQ